MKHIIKGIIFGSIVLPIAAVMYQFVAWFVYGFSESTFTFFGLLIYGASTGTFGILFALIFLVIYGLPLFLVSRYFGFASWLTVAIFAIFPWVIIDGFMNRNIHHFFEFTWYSLVSGSVFWFFARNAVNGKSENA